MKRDRKTREVKVNSFDNWAEFMLRGFVGKQPEGYRHRDDSWDGEMPVEKNDVLHKLLKTKQ